MGWRNPPVPWSELERRLSDRPRPAHGDGGDSPAWGLSLRSATQATAVPSRDGLQPFADAARASQPLHADGGDSPAWGRRRVPYQASSAVVRTPGTVPYAEL